MKILGKLAASYSLGLQGSSFEFQVILTFYEWFEHFFSLSS